MNCRLDHILTNISERAKKICGKAHIQKIHQKVGLFVPGLGFEPKYLPSKGSVLPLDDPGVYA